MDYFKKSLALHKKFKGKLSICGKIAVNSRDALSLAYTPGVAAVSRLIARDKSAAYTHTLKANSVAVVSDGSAVLGLGNIGPAAALPVMEGKAILFKEYADIDAYPICLDTQDTEEIIKAVKWLSVGFGGINLEDISTPRCFEIEERLKKELDIPVMHDDQHGTAIVVLAALINSLKLVGKKVNAIKVVINGAGSAAVAIYKLLVKYGVNEKKIIILDSQGIINKERKNMHPYKHKIAERTNLQNLSGNLEYALAGADVFIGVSVANVLQAEWIDKMAADPIIFAMANPDPEISLENIKKTKVKIFGTGRSDYPNQVNNVLAFPGVFRGALDIRAKEITNQMKLAAAEAIANLIPRNKLRFDYIIPSPLDKRVAPAVARAVKKTAQK